MRSAALAGLVTLAVLLSGCTGLPGYPAASDTPVAQLGAAVDCQAPNLNNNGMVFPAEVPAQTDLTATRPDAPAPGMVPAGFEPVAAYRCTFYGSVDDAEGRWSAVTVETRTGNFDALLAALAEPNDQPGLNQVCTADMEIVPELWLENAAGEALRLAWPRTSCGKTKPATLKALEMLELTETTVLPLVLQIGRDALDAGCAMSMSTPELSLLFGVTSLQTDFGAVGEDLQPIPVPPAETPSYAGVDGASVCFYTVVPAADSELDSIEGIDDEALTGMMRLRFGTFDGATTLAADAATLLPAAASALQAPECSTDPTRFAVIWPERAGTRLDTAIQVELDGCQRLVVPGRHALVPAPALLAALTA
ncbi:hypothetical protein E3O25_15285 [Cryobacterium sp. TMT1-3]|uniref:hypothetical protein n=1 Tax=Cryobacterium sp. TMT1-3 TaxID=1259237 RepID=UPI00106CC393|nr:hypothetical protein [Cryobacterium sp. TMT1-3]TFC24533.1 hypothetical protein E3O25_15285 [Cryobacterium sp. TMT1-3]